MKTLFSCYPRWKILYWVFADQGCFFIRFSYCQDKNFSMNNMINGLKICTFSCGLTVEDS